MAYLNRYFYIRKLEWPVYQMEAMLNLDQMDLLFYMCLLIYMRYYVHADV